MNAYKSAQWELSETRQIIVNARKHVQVHIFLKMMKLEGVLNDVTQPLLVINNLALIMQSIANFHIIESVMKIHIVALQIILEIILQIYALIVNIFLYSLPIYIGHFW